MAMQRASYVAFLAAFGLLLGAGVYADKGKASTRSRSALEESMGEIQWGWTPKQVYRQLKKGIEARYQEPISKTTDAIEEDRLRHKMAEETRQIRDSYFEFDGTATAYDSGYLKGEFTHGNGESLLRVRTKTTQDFFFFINEKLWKRYRAFDASVFHGGLQHIEGSLDTNIHGEQRVVHHRVHTGDGGQVNHVSRPLHRLSYNLRVAYIAPNQCQIGVFLQHGVFDGVAMQGVQDDNAIVFDEER